jgi:hypothetical protein
LARLIARPKAVEDAVVPILARFLPGGRPENAPEVFAQTLETARETALSALSQAERRAARDADGRSR